METAADRAYYSMFHSSRAMLHHEGVPVPKTHSGLRSLVGEKLVRPGIAPRLLSQSLARAAQLREEATYTVYADHGKETVERILEDAQAVLKVARTLCHGR